MLGESQGSKNRPLSVPNAEPANQKTKLLSGINHSPSPEWSGAELLSGGEMEREREKEKGRVGGGRDS